MQDRLLRKRILLLGVYAFFLVIALRLFYWQVLRGNELRLQSEVQTMRSNAEQGLRGKIYTSDNYLLVGNQIAYELKLDRQNFQGDAAWLSRQLASLIIQDNKAYQDTDSASQRQELTDALTTQIEAKFQARGNWPILASGLSEARRDEIVALANPYLHFDQHFQRFYPEASMAAHLTGFVGRDERGNPIGRYGIEGALEDELKARTYQQLLRTDALGFLLAGQKYDNKNLNGRDITLTIRRDIQYLLEKELQQAIGRYSADRGEIIVLESQTGRILGLATWPNYEAWNYAHYEAELLKNPSLTRTYEPGSTFKTLTIATGIDVGAISPETVCTKCAGPRRIANYSIKTWNDQYTPNINMRDAYAKSDNTAMIFIAELIGRDRFVEYLRKFGIGERLQIDLQDDARTSFPKQIGPVELATISFGQGISTNSLTLLRAINTIATGGIRLEPQIIDHVYDHQNQKEIRSPTREGLTVISPTSAATVTDMMVEAAKSGEAKWTATEAYQVAAKTGTSQVPDPKGGYKKDETIVSFIGFAPAHQPEFTMLVKLENTKSSPWAAETAAPLWYRVADKLMLLLNVATN